MELLWSGVKFGLALSLLVGPILFSLVHASIEQGFRAGWTVGLGIWMSDLVFVVATYYGISYVVALTKWEGFQMTMGIAGGIILIVFGIAVLLVNPPLFEGSDKKAVRYSSYFSLWLRGFLINSVNPFTFFFWLGFSTVLFTEKSLEPNEALLFYGGLLGTLVVTDTAKIAMAKVIRRWLKPVVILWMRRVAGVALMVFGVVLLVRASAF